MITKCFRQPSIVLASCFFCALTAMAATEFAQNLDKTFPVSAGGKLVIEADRGSVTVSTDGAAEAKISVLRKIKGASKVQADEMFADHDVKFEQNGSTV